MTVRRWLPAHYAPFRGRLGKPGVTAMRRPAGTRQHIRLLNHRRTSGLFLRNGEYIADIKPDDDGRVIRKLGTDFQHVGTQV